MASKDISSYFAKPAAKATTSSSASASKSKSKSELESSSNGTKRSPETSPSSGSKKSNLPKAMQEAILEGVREAKRTKLDTPAKTAPIFTAASVSGTKSSTEKVNLPKASSKQELSELLSKHEHKKELLQLELDTLGEDWLLALQDELTKPYFLTLKEFVTKEQQTKKVFPPAEDIYSWSRMLPLKDVRVVIVGQDPYHDDGQAHGFAFSVRKGMRIPPSLRNIYKELADEIPDFKIPQHGDLTEWAKHGVLLLNTSLTVRAHEAGSHSNRGWETFTAAVLKVITSRLTPTPTPAISSGSGSDPDPENKAKSDPDENPEEKEDRHVPGAQGVVFMAWGKHAQTMCTGVDKKKHLVLQSAHPSPFAAAKGFFGNGHFKKANEWLEGRYGPKGGIDWAALGPGPGPK